MIWYQKISFPSFFGLWLSQILAVKKLNMVALTVYEENNFLDVVQNLVRLSHTNISKLLGYSVDQGEHILVYDYAKNGSLDDLLFSSSGTHNALSWKARVTIALGVAHALEYVFNLSFFHFV